MDTTPNKTQEEVRALQDEAVRIALEISELEEKDDYDFKLCFSVLFLPLPGMNIATEIHNRKLKEVDRFRQWLKKNKVTPRDFGIGSGFVKTHIPEYNFLY